MTRRHVPCRPRVFAGTRAAPASHAFMVQAQLRRRRMSTNCYVDAARSFSAACRSIIVFVR